MTEISEPPVTERITVTEAGERLIAHLETMGRKPSTLRSDGMQPAGEHHPETGFSIGRPRTA